MENRQTLRINIKTISGQVKDLEVTNDILVSDLKVEISKHFEAPVPRQRLIYQARLLKDTQSLSHYVKESGITIHMLLQSLEGSSSQDTSSQAPQPNPNQSNENQFRSSNPFESLGDASNFIPNFHYSNPMVLGFLNLNIPNLVNRARENGINPPEENTALLTEILQYYNLLLFHISALSRIVPVLQNLITYQYSITFLGAAQLSTINPPAIFTNLAHSALMMIEGLRAILCRIENREAGSFLDSFNGFQIFANSLSILLSTIENFSNPDNMHEILGPNYDIKLDSIISIFEGFTGESRPEWLRTLSNLSIGEAFESFFSNWSAFNCIFPVLKSWLSSMVSTGEINLNEEFFEENDHFPPIPERFNPKMKSGINLDQELKNSTNFWVKKTSNHILNYQGTNGMAELKRNICCYCGNLVDIAVEALHGNVSDGKDLMVSTLLEIIVDIFPGTLTSQVRNSLTNTLNISFTNFHDCYLKYKNENSSNINSMISVPENFSIGSEISDEE
ncbi:unnamed protein product [Blepharisma stoltei]|uniref:Ubiquitin-like domain-containing protein n=1 Tax=Blepharisma stoltei TaxID=1481888 RepID=A0AAU9K3K3_9CILI|nr:unnamed protein product [Blepharisma stoltei]